MVAERVQINWAQHVRERMTGLIRGGMKPVDASLKVRDELVASGDAWELFVVYGHMLVLDVWRMQVSGRQPEPVSAPSSSQRVTPIRGHKQSRPRSPLPVADDGRAFQPGEIDQAGSIFDAPVRVDGEWTTIGNMQRRHCRAMQFYCEAESVAMITKAHFFKRLAQGLEDGRKVRDCFTEQQLRAMFRELAA